MEIVLEVHRPGIMFETGRRLAKFGTQNYT